MSNTQAVPIQTRPTPVTADGLFWEDVEGVAVDAVRPPYGSPHEDTKSFFGFYLCQEQRISQTAARRWWAKEFAIQDTYNDNETYGEQDIQFPSFTRRYVVMRSKYQSLIRTPLQPLMGLTVVHVIAGGTGYNTPPDVTCSGGTGTGAGLTALINKQGEVTGVSIVAAGNYSVVPALVFSGGDGAGASATALIQPQTCILTRQRKVEFSDDDPRRSIFVIHECTYETLPGPEVAELHFDPQTFTERATYRQRVVIGTSANPVAAVEIQQVSVGNPAVVTTLKPHGLLTGTTTVRIAGVSGSTPAVNGDHMATRTGAGTFTIPVNVTVASTALTGFASAMKGGQVILDSYVKPDDDAGAVTGTLLTVCATLPGREVSSARYDSTRAAFVTFYRQYVHLGFGDWFALGSYKGQTIENSDEEPKTAGLALLTTNTILLPGDPVTTLSFDEETGAIRSLIKTRVAIGSSPDAIGGWALPTDIGPFITQSKIVEENSVVGVKITEKTTRPTVTRNEVQDGAEPMPGIFTYLTGWVLGNNGYILHGPFLGINYLLTLHGVSSPAFVEITYTWGKNPSAPVISGIFAPISGRSGIGLPVNGQTLHSDPGTVDGHYQFDEVPLSGPQAGIPQTVEIMPESIPPPDDYVTGDTYLRSYTDRPHEGGPLGLWERRKYFFLAT